MECATGEVLDEGVVEELQLLIEGSGEVDVTNKHKVAFAERVRVIDTVVKPH